MSKSLVRNERVVAIERDFGYLRLCGDEACRWLAEICDGQALEIGGRLSAAFSALKRFDLKTAAYLLAPAHREIQHMETPFPSIRHLLQRYRLTSLAYLHYLEGKLEEAKADLREAHDEIRALITLHEFLMPIAIHCTDFLIQRARLARRESLWKEAERYLWMLRDIYASVRPLCVLDSGRPIGLPEIRSFYASLPLSEEQREQARKMIGDTIPLTERVVYLEEMVFNLPDMVIPYP